MVGWSRITRAEKRRTLWLRRRKMARGRVCKQKKGKRVSGEGLPGGKTVKVDDRRERGIVCDRKGALLM